MINKEKFLSDIESLYRISGNDAVRVSQHGQILHYINIKGLDLTSTNINFRHLDMGHDFINQYKILAAKIKVYAYQEFNSCHKQYIYRISVTNSTPDPLFPVNYNSVNSNDYKFANKIFNQMRSYVR